MVHNRWGDAPSADDASSESRSWWRFAILIAVPLLGVWGGYRFLRLSNGPEQIFLPGEFGHHDLIVVAPPPQLRASEGAVGDALVRLLAAHGDVWTGNSPQRLADYTADSPSAPGAPQRTFEVRGLAPPNQAGREIPWRVLKDHTGEHFLATTVVEPTVRSIARELKLPLRSWTGPPWRRLITNGAGLWLIARKDQENDEVGQWRDQLLEKGAIELIPLESLQAKNGAGRVEHIAAFLAADTVLVGQADPVADPRNARILDDNAARLAGLRTPFGPLRVVRVPLPPLKEGLVRSYTSLVLFNRLAVVPTYEDAPLLNQAFREKLATLLPRWRVEDLSCDAITLYGDSLHDWVLPIAWAGKEATSQ